MKVVTTFSHIEGYLKQWKEEILPSVLEESEGGHESELIASGTYSHGKKV